MSINDATPDEWDRASRAIDDWVRNNKPIQNERGVGGMKTSPNVMCQVNQGAGVRISVESVSDFCRGAGRTAKRVDFTFDLLHAALGLTSEAGEFADAVKKNVVYGKPLDKENLIEELGDLLWFTSLACDVLNVDMAFVMEENIKKLQKRYPEKYTDFHAISRQDKGI